MLALSEGAPGGESHAGDLWIQQSNFLGQGKAQVQNGKCASHNPRTRKRWDVEQWRGTVCMARWQGGGAPELYGEKTVRPDADMRTADCRRSVSLPDTPTTFYIPHSAKGLIHI